MTSDISYRWDRRMVRISRELARRPRNMRLGRGALILVAVGLTTAMAVPPAHAKGGGATKPSPTHSWDGPCSVEGLVHFDPPATAFQQLLAVTYDATGTCTGQLDGRAVSGAPVEMHNFVHSNGSCLYAQ